MKETINEHHITLSETLINMEDELNSIKGFEYFKFIGNIFYPKNSFNTNKYYLVSLEYYNDVVPINILSEKSNKEDALKVFFKYIALKYPNIQYNNDIIFNMIIYKNPTKIKGNIAESFMSNKISPKIQTSRNVSLDTKHQHLIIF